MSTQFSFGRLFVGAVAAIARRRHDARSRSFREWREERRREQQRREVIAKHTKKGAPPPEIKASGRRRACRHPKRRGRHESASRARTPRPPRRTAGVRQRESFAPPSRPRSRMPAPPLPLSDPEADGEGAGRAAQGRVRAAAAGAARRAEDRAQDRRARADGRRAAARGEVPRVLGRRQRSCRSTRARSSRPSSSSRTPA